MKIPTKEEKFLIELYNQQNKSADNLGGTKELLVIQRAYNKRYGSLTQTQIQTQLIALRKAGVLGTLGVRIPKEMPKPTWPQPKDCQDKTYTLKLDIIINRDIILNIIWSMIYLGFKPVSRREIYEFLVNNTQYASIAFQEGVHFNEDVETAKRLMHQLFPEMI